MWLIFRGLSHSQTTFHLTQQSSFCKGVWSYLTAWLLVIQWLYSSLSLSLSPCVCKPRPSPKTNYIFFWHLVSHMKRKKTVNQLFNIKLIHNFELYLLTCISPILHAVCYACIIPGSLPCCSSLLCSLMELCTLENHQHEIGINCMCCYITVADVKIKRPPVS